MMGISISLSHSIFSITCAFLLSPKPVSHRALHILVQRKQFADTTKNSRNIVSCSSFPLLKSTIQTNQTTGTVTRNRSRGKVCVRNHYSPYAFSLDTNLIRVTHLRKNLQKLRGKAARYTLQNSHSPVSTRCNYNKQQIHAYPVHPTHLSTTSALEDSPPEASPPSVAA